MAKMVQLYGTIVVRVRQTLLLLKTLSYRLIFTHLFNLICSLLSIVHIPEVCWKKTAKFCNLIYYRFHLLIWKEVDKTNWFTARVKWCWNTEHRCTRAQSFFPQLIISAEKRKNTALICIFGGMFWVFLEESSDSVGCLGIPG